MNKKIFYLLLCTLTTSIQCSYRDEIHPNKLLFISVKNKNIDGVQQALDNGAEINAQDKKGNTALHHAANLFKTTDPSAMIRLLIEVGINEYIQNHDGQCAWGVQISRPTIKKSQLGYNLLNIFGQIAHDSSHPKDFAESEYSKKYSENQI